MVEMPQIPAKGDEVFLVDVGLLIVEEVIWYPEGDAGPGPAPYDVHVIGRPKFEGVAEAAE